MTLWSIALAMLCLCGCVDPFADQTTSPTKYLRETSAAVKEKAASEAKADKDNTSAAKGTEKAKEKEEPKQTYREAWQLICEAEQRSAVSPDKSRSDRGAAVASWIVNNVTNKEARYWFIEFGNAKPQSKTAIFLAEVERVGIEPCPLTKLLFSADERSAVGATAGDGGPPDAG